MGLFFRKSIKIGPVRLNFGRNGYTSTTIEAGPLSRNSRTKRTRLDLPGPFSWLFGR